MPKFTKGDASQLSAVDPNGGTKFRFSLPHSTDDPAEIRALKAARAEMTSAEEEKSKPKSKKVGDDE